MCFRKVMRYGAKINKIKWHCNFICIAVSPNTPRVEVNFF